jgi:phytoene dehydrogenase-like protein
MGSITQAMAKECAARGVEIRVDTRVERVVVERGRAVGVETSNGQIVRAKRVVANVNPKLLFEQLVPREHVDPDFQKRIAAYRCGSGTFRINVALAELPDFRALGGSNAQPHHASGIIVGPSLRYMEQAYFEARTEGWSRAPVVEMLIPSVVDDSLAPPGRHVASLFCQHVNPRIEDVHSGKTWDDFRDRVADLMIETVNNVAPNFTASVVAR